MTIAQSGARALWFALSLALAAAAPAEADPRLRQCAFSRSPDGRHVAMFTWRGGRLVDLVVCDFSCSPLRAYPRGAIRSYRWEAPGVIVLFDARTLVRQRIATFRGIQAFAAPASDAAGRDLHPVAIGRRTCFLPENNIVG